MMAAVYKTSPAYCRKGTSKINSFGTKLNLLKITMEILFVSLVTP